MSAFVLARRHTKASARPGCDGPQGFGQLIAKSLWAVVLPSRFNCIGNAMNLFLLTASKTATSPERALETTPAFLPGKLESNRKVLRFERRAHFQGYSHRPPKLYSPSGWSPRPLFDRARCRFLPPAAVGMSASFLRAFRSIAVTEPIQCWRQKLAPLGTRNDHHVRNILRSDAAAPFLSSHRQSAAPCCTWP